MAGKINKEAAVAALEETEVEDFRLYSFGNFNGGRGCPVTEMTGVPIDEIYRDRNTTPSALAAEMFGGEEEDWMNVARQVDKRGGGEFRRERRKTKNLSRRCAQDLPAGN